MQDPRRLADAPDGADDELAQARGGGRGRCYDLDP
jgi:hypothetical protein